MHGFKPNLSFAESGTDFVPSTWIFSKCSPPKQASLNRFLKSDSFDVRLGRQTKHETSVGVHGRNWVLQGG